MTKITDCVIGCASGYDWKQSQPWIKTLRDTGFDGDIIITGTNISKDTIDWYSDNDVAVHLYGKKEPDGSVKSDSSTPAHVERFFYIWNVLDKEKMQTNNYRFVLTTDVRDVVFQADPMKWMANKLGMHTMVASSEGMRYMNEPWGNNNLYQAMGPYFHQKMMKNMIYNVGVIGGYYEDVRALCLMIYQMSLGRPIPIVDQAVYNFLMTELPYSRNTFFAENADCWAVNLGTTLGAVKSGHGELGQKYSGDLKKYEAMYEDIQPKIDADGNVTLPDGKKFYIVHQWDRIPALKEKFGGK